MSKPEEDGNNKKAIIWGVLFVIAIFQLSRATLSNFRPNTIHEFVLVDITATFITVCICIYAVLNNTTK